jgi:hypothetical protein
LAGRLLLSRWEIKRLQHSLRKPWKIPSLHTNQRMRDQLLSITDRPQHCLSEAIRDPLPCQERRTLET